MFEELDLAVAAVQPEPRITTSTINTDCHCLTSLCHNCGPNHNLTC